MSGVNKAILLGRLGRDPEVRHLDNGTCVARINIATSETFKDRNTGEKREITEWHQVVIWRGLAEVAEKYLRKGSQVYIEGKLRTRSWEKDGVTHYTTEVAADNMTMLGGNQSNRPPIPTEDQQPITAGPTSSGDEAATDDLPF